MKPGFVSPPAIEVVVVDFGVLGVADDRVSPVTQLHSPTGCFCREELRRAVSWRWKCEALAGGADRHGIANFGDDFNEMRHVQSSFLGKG